MAIVARHGCSVKRTPEYCAWVSMKQRCVNPANPSFAYYGGRDIAVCPQWRDSFPQFLSDMGARPSSNHTLERLDNERGYEPGNVAWATRTVQQRNRRTSRKITWNGVTLTLIEWAEKLGIPRTTLNKRLNVWPLPKAMSAPISESHRRHV